MGGDLLVRGAVALARRARVSPVVVAATVVALGTSVPELVVSVQAALAGYPSIVLGNVVGSNIANVLLVAGGSAAIYPLVTDQATLRRDSAVMLGVSFGFVAVCAWWSLDLMAGIVLLAGLALVWTAAAREAAADHKEAAPANPLDWVLGLPSSLGMSALFIAFGLIMLPLGANQVVDATVEIAAQLGVSEAVIGLTILAFSTSLPELATTGVAAYQRRTEVALGTIIGSNVINILAVMGAASVVSPDPIAVPDTFYVLDFPVMIGAAILATLFVWIRRPLGRLPGVAMVVAYVGYIATLFLVAGGS